MKRIQATALSGHALRRQVQERDTETTVREIVHSVREGGEQALRRWAEGLDGAKPGQALLFERDELIASLEQLGRDQRGLLERTEKRIAAFAQAQRASIHDLNVAVPGGRAGHRVDPVERAGCYAPGGRYPLPSSVLMTATTARIAGVRDITVASPRPGPITLAAAAVAGADRLLAVGGAQAIAALAYGIEALPPCDVIAGPGNRWVTAAKRLVSGDVGIDMLAGPSELCVLADETADPELVAADLLAQAEHDEDARLYLVTTHSDLAVRVDHALERQLRRLSTRPVAEVAVARGLTIVCRDLDEAIKASDLIAAEHLELMVGDAAAVGSKVRNYGALFVGAMAAEVFGDYGIGPNHVLPTSQTARHQGGLSVMSFLRVRSWLELESVDEQLCADVAALARLEGLEGHACAAEQRRSLHGHGSQA